MLSHRDLCIIYRDNGNDKSNEEILDIEVCFVPLIWVMKCQNVGATAWVSVIQVSHLSMSHLSSFHMSLVVCKFYVNQF